MLITLQYSIGFTIHQHASATGVGWGRGVEETCPSKNISPDDSSGVKVWDTLSINDTLTESLRGMPLPCVFYTKFSKSSVL